MWRTVTRTQPLSKRSRQRMESMNRDGSAVAGSGVSTSTTVGDMKSRKPCTEAEVRRTVKDLKKAVHALSGSIELFRVHLLQTLRKRLQAMIQREESISPIRCVRAIGVGIGLFAREESRVSFLQMAAFLTIKRVCEEVVQAQQDRRAKLCGESAEGSSDGGAPYVPLSLRCTFVEPLAGPLHDACCKELGIGIGENTLGVYKAEEGEVLMLFMPHCPWVLLHNTFASNWPVAEPTLIEPSSSEEALDRTAAAAIPLRRCLFVANDLHAAPLLASSVSSSAAAASKRLCIFSDAVLSCVSCQPLCEVQLKRRAGRKALLYDGEGGGDKDEDEEELHNMSGLSLQDVQKAFSDVAVMSVEEAISDVELSERLRKFSSRQPKLVRRSPELY